MQAREFTILSAERSYEYRIDAIKLTMLGIAEVRQTIQETFGFQLGQIGRPMPTFGDVPTTLPPGIVFNFGRVPNPDGTVTPIRLIHFESQRIVINIAGPSSAIDVVFERLTSLTESLRMPDGSPVVGEPSRIREYSELSFEAGATLEGAFHPQFASIARQALAIEGKREKRVLVPRIGFHLMDPDETYHGLIAPDPELLQLDLRASTRVGERIIFSEAPLDTDTHIMYLREVVAFLEGGKERPT